MTEVERATRGPRVRGDRVPAQEWGTFEEFYRAELPGVVALARGLCPPAVAEDVAQEAMLAAYRRWTELGSHPNREAWVRRTCANLAVSAFRRRVIEMRAVARLARRRDPIELDEASEEFWALVRRLPRRQAQSVALRYVFGMDVREIAEVLGVAEGSVKVHLSRARQRLATEMHLETEEAS